VIKEHHSKENKTKRKKFTELRYFHLYKGMISIIIHSKHFSISDLFIYYLIAFTMITMLKKTRGKKKHLNKTQK